MELLRTPDERFANLPDFPYEPRHVEVDGGLRAAYVEAGPPGGPVVVLLHGEPTWSFLYRRVLGVLAGAGVRAIAPDMVGSRPIGQARRRRRPQLRPARGLDGRDPVRGVEPA